MGMVLPEDRPQNQKRGLLLKIIFIIIDYSDFVEEELELVKKTEQTLAKKYKFIIQDHNVVFYGLCETCRQAKGESV